MKKHFLLSVILTIAFLCVLPVSTMAATASGTCGEGVNWALDDSGVLTISGTGAMTNFISSIP